MILATRSGNRELRAFTPEDFGINDRPGSSSAGTMVTSKTACGIPAVNNVVRMAAEQVASTELGVWRGLGVDRRAVSTTWQSRLFAQRPNPQQTLFGFWETVQESIDYRGNAYVWCNVDPSSRQIVEWFALHPDQVVPVYTVAGERTYQVLTAPWWVDPVGKGSGWFRKGEDVILHVKGFGDGGKWIAPSPLERERGALHVALAKIAHEGKMYDQSANPSIVVSYPGELTAEQLTDYAAAMQAMYGGPDGTGRIGVTGGGATITRVGMSLADVQFVESQQFDVDQVARIFNWEASLLGGGGLSGTAGAVGPKSPEHEQMRLLRYRLIPRLKRIEAALVAYPPLALGGRDYPMFNTDRALRGDLATEALISQGKVQSGQWTPNESRALDGLSPLGYMVKDPNGEGLIDAGDIPQITPVGGAPNSNPPAAPAAA